MIKSTKFQFVTLIIALLITALSCDAQKQSIKVTPLKEVKSALQNSMFYYLPKNVIVVEIDATQTISFKGPYHQFTERYLGFKNLTNENKINWKIDKVDLSSYPVADTTYCYVIENIGNTSAHLVSLTEDGLLRGINIDPVQENLYVTYEHKNINDEITNSISDAPDSVNYFSAEDTMFFRVPLLKKNLELRSKEEQASDIANLILSIRDDRNALIVGEADTKSMPDGQALAVMINELNRLENQYLSLFVGKTIKKSYKYRFEFTPGESKPFVQKNLCRFSGYSGILSTKIFKGLPITIEVTSENSSASIKKFNNDQDWFWRIDNKKKNEKGLYYKIPESASVKIVLGKDIIAQRDMILGQYSSEAYLPLYLLKTPSYRIDFIPEYGCLKSIQQIVPINTK